MSVGFGGFLSSAGILGDVRSMVSLCGLSESLVLKGIGDQQTQCPHRTGAFALV